MSTVTNTNSSTATNTSSVPSAASRLNTNYQDFLKLLTTQLTNQDPTQPADTNQLTEQIASLSQVEQQINTNNYLQQLVSLLNANQVNNAVSYIGKQIDAEGNQGQLSNGRGIFVYELPAGASKATVTITDSAGKTVFTGPGTTLAGRNQVVWDGINSVTGATMPAGVYNFSIAAKDAGGKDLTTKTFTTGTVTAVDTQNETTNLMIGKVSVPMKNIKAIYTAGTNPGA